MKRKNSGTSDVDHPHFQYQLSSLNAFHFVTPSEKRTTPPICDLGFVFMAITWHDLMTDLLFELAGNLLNLQ